MGKSIGMIILLVVILTFGGCVYADILPTQNVPDGTDVTFINNGNSWVHTVVVFENMAKKDGTIGNIYADIWLKPKENGIPGTISIDLSKILGYGNNPLPTGTKIRMNTWGNLLGTYGETDTLKLQIDSNTANSNSPTNTIEKPNIHVLPLPQSIINNNIKISEDPATGGEYLSNLASNEGSNWNIAKSLTIDGTGVAHAQNLEQAVLCIAAGGEENVQGLVSGGESRVEETIPLQKTGVPAIIAVLSAFLVVSGLLYKKLLN